MYSHRSILKCILPSTESKNRAHIFQFVFRSRSCKIGLSHYSLNYSRLYIQIRSVPQLCLTLCDPMKRSTPGLPVHHQLPEFTQTHVHRVSVPPSHLILCRPLFLLPPIPPSIRVFSNESTLRMKWTKYWSFSFSIIPSKEIPGLIFRMDWLRVLAVKGTLKSLLQHHSSISRPYLLSYTISRPHTPPHTLACPCMPSCYSCPHTFSHTLTHLCMLSHAFACPHCPCMHSHGHTFPSMSSHALTSPHTLSQPRAPLHILLCSRTSLHIFESPWLPLHTITHSPTSSHALAHPCTLLHSLPLPHTLLHSSHNIEVLHLLAHPYTPSHTVTHLHFLSHPCTLLHSIDNPHTLIFHCTRSHTYTTLLTLTVLGHPHTFLYFLPCSYNP